MLDAWRQGVTKRPTLPGSKAEFARVKVCEVIDGDWGEYVDTEQKAYAWCQVQPLRTAIHCN